MAEPATDHDSLELQTSSQQEDEAHIQEHATLTERTHLLRRKLRLEVSSNCITGIPDKNTLAIIKVARSSSSGNLDLLSVLTISSRQ